MRFGSGEFIFELVEDWGKGLNDWEDSLWGLRKVPGIAIDSKDNVYI